MDLSFFQGDLYEALQSLFAQLHVPVNPLDKNPIRPSEILKNTFKENHEAFALIEDAIAFGMIDDGAFANAQSAALTDIKKTKRDYDGILIFGVRLKERSKKRAYPSRSRLAEITRAFNREFHYTPVLVVLRYDDCISIAHAERIAYTQAWREGEKVAKVRLLKDIDIRKPHTGHLKILEELRIQAGSDITSFADLYDHWQKALDTSILNRNFYRELYAWFEMAHQKAKLPAKNLKPEEHVIRLITRLMFCWFIKEKKLIADSLFQEEQAGALLKNYDRKKGHSYYRAILQNLFFATLNTPIDKRRFSKKTQADHRNFSLYRYEDEIQDADSLLRLFAKTPFINGGLFDCLDSFESKTGGGARIDYFTDNLKDPKKEEYHKLLFSNDLFFSEDEKKPGLIHLFNKYKFTVEENTPMEQEVALDPELLGKVFENLLAAHNPETRDTARKQTGSYYTPREVVDYMVCESLTAYFKSYCKTKDAGQGISEDTLRQLLSYASTQAPNLHEAQKDLIVEATARLKILDPAVGSGAFPMGILHALTLLLRRLDPDNKRWRRMQKDIAMSRLANAMEEEKDQELRQAKMKEIDDFFEQYSNSDFGRKLYLIENAIYGVDMQPIACHLAKLRFFISLAIEQEAGTDPKNNYAIRPLPNLETRFIAANSLVALEKAAAPELIYRSVRRLVQDLGKNRERYFHAKSRNEKMQLRAQDRKLRRQLADALKGHAFKADTAEKIANWDPYDQNAPAADWFDPEYMYGIRDGFDIVIGNPPYVRQENITRLKATLKKQYACYTGKSDLYVYFYERGLRLLNKRGVHSFVCSNSWLDVGYGAPLQKYLLENTRAALICHSEAKREFASADINTIVSILQNGKAEADSQFRFLSFKTFIGDPNIKNRRERVRSYAELKQEGTNDETYTGNKWGGKYLRAPDIYWTILKKGKDKLAPLSDIAEVRRGFTTGANEFFYLDAARIQEWGMEAKFLRPVIKSPRECKGILVDPRQLSYKLFMCHADKADLAGTAALEYIKWGEKQGFHQRPSCKGRPRWWDLGDREFADLLWIETMHETFKVHRNAPAIYESDKFYGIQSQDNVDKLTILLNSTPMMLFKLLSGFHSLGGGALKTAVYEVQNFCIIQPKLIAFHMDLVNMLIKREVGTIQEDITHSNRRALDAIIFDVLGLSQGERDGVYEAVVKLVEARLRKAASAREK